MSGLIPTKHWLTMVYRPLGKIVIGTMTILVLTGIFTYSYILVADNILDRNQFVHAAKTPPHGLG